MSRSVFRLLHLLRESKTFEEKNNHHERPNPTPSYSSTDNWYVDISSRKTFTKHKIVLKAPYMSLMAAHALEMLFSNKIDKSTLDTSKREQIHNDKRPTTSTINGCLCSPTAVEFSKLKTSTRKCQYVVIRSIISCQDEYERILLGKYAMPSVGVRL
jgi:hypothetical protein